MLKQKIKQLSSEQQLGSMKVLQQFNELQKSYSTQNIQDIKKENNKKFHYFSQSQEKQDKSQQKTTNKIQSIVELIKQELIPILECQNDRIEKLEKRIKPNLSDLDQQTKIKNINNCENKDEIQKLHNEINHLEGFIKQQYVKLKNEKFQEKENYLEIVQQLKKANCDIELIKKQFKQINSTIDEKQKSIDNLQEQIINQIEKNTVIYKQNLSLSIDELFQKMELHIFQYLQQPILTIKNLQQNQISYKEKLDQIENQICTQQILFQNCPFCQQKIIISDEYLQIECNHQYHKNCFNKMLIQQVNQKQNIECEICQHKIKLNKFTTKIENQIVERYYQNQLLQLISKFNLNITFCNNCNFCWIKNNKLFEQCNQCLSE